jgi:hypothetical protein
MSYELAKFSTVNLHGLDCVECSQFRHPSAIHLPHLTSQLTIIRSDYYR